MTAGDQIKQELNENRILILVLQVFLGLQFHSSFQPGFEALPPGGRYAHLASLALIVFSFLLLTAPASFHRLCEDGRNSKEFDGFLSLCMRIGVFPLAVALGISLSVAARFALGPGLSKAFGAGGLIVAAYFWYGMEFLQRRRSGMKTCRHYHGKETPPREQSGSIEEKVDHVLTEARMVLPGSQALLGFQFSIVFLEAYGKLPRSAHLAHIISLIFLMLSMILLMTPAIYHRTVEEGRVTEHFHEFSSRLLVLAMACLGIGICLDIYLVGVKVSGRPGVSAASAAAGLVLFAVFWAGLPLIASSNRRLRAIARHEAAR